MGLGFLQVLGRPAGWSFRPGRLAVKGIGPAQDRRIGPKAHLRGRGSPAPPRGVVRGPVARSLWPDPAGPPLPPRGHGAPELWNEGATRWRFCSTVPPTRDGGPGQDRWVGRGAPELWNEGATRWRFCSTVPPTRDGGPTPGPDDPTDQPSAPRPSPGAPPNRPDAERPAPALAEAPPWLASSSHCQRSRISHRGWPGCRHAKPVRH